MRELLKRIFCMHDWDKTRGHGYAVDGAVCRKCKKVYNVKRRIEY